MEVNRLINNPLMEKKHLECVSLAWCFEVNVVVWSVHNSRGLPSEGCLSQSVIAVASIISPTSVVGREWNVAYLTERLEGGGQRISMLFDWRSNIKGSWAIAGDGSFDCWSIYAGRTARASAETCVDLGPSARYNCTTDWREGHVRSFQEILIDLILHEAIESVTDALGIRILHILSTMYFVMLLEILILVIFALLCQVFSTLPLHSSIVRLGSRAAIWIIAVIEFVWVDELSLIFILVISLDVLLGLAVAALKSRSVCGIASLLNRTWLNWTKDRNVVLSNRIVRQ